MTKAVTLPKLKAKLQLIFNQYIRLRDKDKPCISCGQFKDLQAGHFYSVRMYDGLRFNEDNCHGECAGCNAFDDMHLLKYWQNIQERIGTDRYLSLCDKAQNYKEFGYKWSRSELLEKIEFYKNKIKEL
jgi:hypothetical protein